MQTRGDFYRSEPWARLLAQLKTERLDQEGNLICEYCGRPIVRAYDIIGHHKQELTEENFRDATIALNPANVALVHHACHNRIHDRFNASYTRQVFIVYGPPLAGKREFVRSSKADGDLIVDLDGIWESISGEEFRHPNRLKAVAFKIRDAELDIVKHRLGKWLNAYIIGGYPLQSERERLAKELGAREIYIDASPEDCLKKLEGKSAEIRAEYSEYIAEWFHRYTPPKDF